MGFKLEHMRWAKATMGMVQFPFPFLLQDILKNVYYFPKARFSIHSFNAILFDKNFKASSKLLKSLRKKNFSFLLTPYPLNLNHRFAAVAKD